MGEFYIDISNWADRLYDYSRKMICNFEIFEYSESYQSFIIAENESEILKNLIFDPVKSHLHWLGLGVGIEIFIKSILLKYEILPITNRKITQKYPRKNVFLFSR